MAGDVKPRSHDPADDSDLPRCPKCDYCLIGLTADRCPECGSDFRWEDSRLYQRGRPAIAFQSWSGWRKLPGLVVTWFTALFLPWIFARQTLRPVGLLHAAVFFTVCYVVLFTAAQGNSYPTIFGIILAALAQIFAQSAMFSLIERPGLKNALTAFPTWLAIGGYTTAIVVLEYRDGPPLLMFNDFVERIAATIQQRELNRGLMFGPPNSSLDEAFWFYLPLALWIIGLVTCLAVRLHARGRAPRTIVLLMALASIALLFLYSASVQFVGYNAYRVFGGPI